MQKLRNDEEIFKYIYYYFNIRGTIEYLLARSFYLECKNKGKYFDSYDS